MIYLQDNAWTSLGRLGNKMFIHSFGNFLAEKNNLKWECKIEEEFPKNLIKTSQHSGEVKEKAISINDSSCYYFIENKINYGAEIYGWFQEEQLVNNSQYAKYLCSVFKINKYEDDISNENVFVHVRAGDIGHDNRMLPYEYYESQLISLKFKAGSISSDDLNHPTVVRLVDKFNLKKFEGTPEETIRFGSSHSKIVLSLGSFSYWIGLLSKPNTEIASITMSEAISQYSTAWWHPNYDLKKARIYVNT